MSTRSTTHFFDGAETKPTAIIYRHSDGYPSGAGSDLLAFLDVLEAKVPDNRFSHASYLAAKYVAFLTRLFNIGYKGDGVYAPNASPLEFLSVGIVSEDPGDIEYRYEVRCVAGRPTVKCFPMKYNGRNETLTKTAEVKIPAPKENKLRDLILNTPLSKKFVVPKEEEVAA